MVGGTQRVRRLISQLVVDEASAGDEGGGLPPKARIDALHVAVATVHGMEYLVTWNCVHIANAANRARIEKVCMTAGFDPPIICTPLELAEE